MKTPIVLKSVFLTLGTLLATSALAAAPAPFVVDFSQSAGSVRRLNGVCNAAPLSNSHTKSLNDLFLKLEIPYYRFHDASLENPGIELVDINRIFPLFHADVNDPRNYDFRATDDYLKQVVDAGAEIEFRLGESIEHSKNQYFVNVPADYAKWAEICVHIIRHYTKGWANGYHWNVPRWTIWEEPNTNPQLLNVPNREWQKYYFPFYATVAKRIKDEFPHLMVGGPQTNNGGPGAVKAFVEYCASNAVPLDILSWSSYARDPENVAAEVKACRKLMDDNGYTKSKLSICEWHFGPIGWGGHGTVNSPRYARAWANDLSGTLGAAYTAAALIHLQDAPIDYMYYYAAKCGCWGLLDGSGTPYGSYWAMYAFAQVAKGEVRVAAPLQPCPNWWVLASKDSKTGAGRVLLVTMRTDFNCPKLLLKGGVRPVSIKVLDTARDFEDFRDWDWDEKAGLLSIHRNVGDSAFWLIETRPLLVNDGKK